jgi:hypothetical protein
MTIEVELKEIKSLLSELKQKMDVLLEEKETSTMMGLSEKSLKGFFAKEPGIYTIKDIKAKVNCSN